MRAGIPRELLDKSVPELAVILGVPETRLHRRIYRGNQTKPYSV